jgi:hypothetical protein
LTASNLPAKDLSHTLKDVSDGRMTSLDSQKLLLPLQQQMWLW